MATPCEYLQRVAGQRFRHPCECWLRSGKANAGFATSRIPASPRVPRVPLRSCSAAKCSRFREAGCRFYSDFLFHSEASKVFSFLKKEIAQTGRFLHFVGKFFNALFTKTLLYMRTSAAGLDPVLHLLASCGRQGWQGEATSATPADLLGAGRSHP